MKKRRHTVALVVTFDKPIPHGRAVAAVKDCIHSEFYPYEPQTGAGEFKVITVKPVPSNAPKAARTEQFGAADYTHVSDVSITTTE